MVDGGECVVEYRIGGDEPASLAVVNALQNTEFADEPTWALHDFVDADALDRLFDPLQDGTPRKEGMLAFEAGEYLVVVSTDTVCVCDAG
jgi:hypothetical protein